jgi:hypothetical protein
MAVQEINNKSDGMYDDILPDTQLRLSLGDSRGSFNLAVESAYRLLDLRRPLFFGRDNRYTGDHTKLPLTILF